MSPDSFPCERCGKPQDTMEITAFGDKERRYVALGCPCPRPHCPFCNGLLDQGGRCQTVSCFMWFTVIPIPVML